MGINLIDKIVPKNGGFTGLVDANQVIGGGGSGVLPDACMPLCTAEGADTTCFPVFVTDATGGLVPKTHASYTFNAATCVLSATGFSGALTGNVTGDCSGSSGTCTGNAGSATYASAVTVADTVSATCYVGMFEAATGNLGAKTDGGLLYNAATGALGIGIAPSYRLDVSGGDIRLAEGQYYRYGTGILVYAQTALHNYYFGSAGNLTTTGTYNTAVGDLSGVNLGVAANGNTFVGALTGCQNQTGTRNTFVGAYSGQGVAGAYTGSDSNVGVGCYSLYNIVSNTDGNTAVGTLAGYNSSTGTYNVFVGMGAGYGFAGVYAGSNYNVAVGYRAGYDIGAAALNNTLIGAYAGENLTTGDGNVLLGYSAGSAITTESNKLYIANSSAGVGSKLIVGDFSTGYVGIGTIAPLTRLHLNAKIGDDAAYSYDANALMVVHQTGTGTAVLNDPKTVLYLGRQGTLAESYGAMAFFSISRYENDGANSRTRLDIDLMHNYFTPATVLTLLSSGNVGIGTVAPDALLHINAPNGWYADDGSKPVQILSVDGTDFGRMYMGGNIQFYIDSPDEYPLVLQAHGGYVGIGVGAVWPSSLLDIEGAGTVTADVNFLEITNTANAASMTNTRTSILWNQWYYDASTPAVADAAKITVSAIGNWISDPAYQDSRMTFHTVVGGTLTEGLRIEGPDVLVAGEFGCNGAGPSAPVTCPPLPSYATGTYGLDSAVNMAALFDAVLAIKNALFDFGLCVDP